MRDWEPCVVEENVNGQQEMRLLSRELSNRNIYIRGEIDENMANDFLLQMQYLEHTGREAINIFINSGGGKIEAGLLMYDLIVNCSVPVNLVCAGMAGSMAAILFSCGIKGRRFIYPHSRTMIHEPLIQAGMGGSATSIKNISDSILKTKEQMAEILSKHTGRSIKEVKKDISYDHFMNAQESVQYGLCDRILTNCMELTEERK